MKNFVVKRDQELDLPLLWVGDEEELSYTVVLSEEGASVRLNASLLGKPSDKLALEVTIIHAAPHTKSVVDICGLVSESVTINARGMIRIEEGAKGSDAKLSAKFLTLADTSQCSFTPSLEIFEQDVMASHSLTIGQPDEALVFYLASRGLSFGAARELIAFGFIHKSLQHLSPSMHGIAADALQRLCL